jgi:hypothetical protein
MQTADQIVKEHLKASRELQKSLEKSLRKAREFLVRVGVLNKRGTKPARRHR